MDMKVYQEKMEAQLAELRAHLEVLKGQGQRSQRRGQDRNE